MEENQSEVLDATMTSTKRPGENKWHFLYSRYHETDDRIETIHMSAAYGRTPDQALKELFDSFREHGYTRPIEEWKEAIETEELKVIFFKEDESENMPFDPKCALENS